MKPFITVVCLSLYGVLCTAQGLPVGIFAQALKDGKASAPLPKNTAYDSMVAAIRSSTGDSGPLVVNAYRILRFKQQTHCGRVGFMIAQPSTNKAWRDLGGQLNICEDGTPPWRICSSNPDLLIPQDSVCADKSTPQNTPEVDAAIQNALATGSLSHEAIRKSMASPQKPNN